MTDMLTVSEVQTYYGRIQALKGVSLTVGRGEIVTLIGANGAGKATLLMTICGRPPATKGTLLFDGIGITHRETFEIVRMGIAQSPEGRRIFSRMTVLENLQMGATTGEPQHFAQDVGRGHTL